MKPPNRGIRDFLEHSRFAKVALKIIGVVGVALIMSGVYESMDQLCALLLMFEDGVLTPAQSVLGSIQGMLDSENFHVSSNLCKGLKVVAPNISTSTIIGVTCAILILLFLIQPFGTSKLGTTYAPIVVVWLSFNFSFGIYVGLPILRLSRIYRRNIAYTSAHVGFSKFRISSSLIIPY